MAELKTTRTDRPVAEFLASIPDERVRRDCEEVAALMRDATGAEPAMWGDSLVGFGAYRYTYASGRTGEWPLVGFAPRRQNLTLYVMAGFDRYPELLARLGKYSCGRSCLYVRRLADVDRATLAELVRESVAYLRATYPEG